jgi:hypothetical protein
VVLLKIERSEPVKLTSNQHNLTPHPEELRVEGAKRLEG